MFDDDYMKYDYRAHRYILTDKAVLDNIGENLDTLLPSGSSEKFLRRISNVVYNFIYATSQAPDYIEYILANDDGLRDSVFEMLLSQVEYTLMNGAVDLASGVNIAKQQAMPIEALRGGAQVSTVTEGIANRILPRYGHSLRYAGTLPHILPQAYRVGY